MIQKRMVPKQIITHLLQVYVLSHLVKFKSLVVLVMQILNECNITGQMGFSL